LNHPEDFFGRYDYDPFFFYLGIFFAEQAKSECDWVATSSVFVASQSSPPDFSKLSKIAHLLVHTRLKSTVVLSESLVSLYLSVP
jgi:hypothetical protein